MKEVTFLFGIHNHQPVGNFDSVIEDAYHKAYLPFLTVLEKHPGVRLALHNSGILLDWFEARHPDYLDRVRRLVEKGQVELITGGYYEPILPAIPDEDKVGQIRKLTAFLKKRLGGEATGLWLTERVWEPGLVGPLARAGVRYIMVDDAHFLAAGSQPDELWNYWLTEDQGDTVGVWPISKKLRYLVPFEPPEQTIDFLRQLASGGPGRVALLADDGEKFGVWPDTHHQVYEKGWLDQFFTLLEQNADWLKVALPGQVTAARPPQGRIYLPTASYSEMMEWALPTAVQVNFHRFHEKLAHADAPEERFVRGGFWRNFLAKYPEANQMHKRMLQARLDLDQGAALPEAVRAAALDDVWQAQCNCAYWHGVFGGLYLPHLRDALYRKILSAERRQDDARHPAGPFLRVDRRDLDRDGHEDVRLINRQVGVQLAPVRGGALEELDVYGLDRSVSHGMSRRAEAYHERLKEAAAAGTVVLTGPAAASASAVEGTNGAADDGSVKSIHDRVEMKEPDLDKQLFVDWYRRQSLLDHFFRSDGTLADFHRGSYGEQGGFIEQPYAVEVAESTSGVAVTLRRTAPVWVGGEARSVTVQKVIRMTPTGAGFTADYTITLEPAADASSAPVPLWFGVEFNLAMLAGRSDDRYYLVDGEKPAVAPWLAGQGEHAEARAVALRDDWEGLRVELAWSVPAGLWRTPIETVSQSEGGFEKVYQSSCVVPHWRIELRPGESWQVSLEVATSLADWVVPRK